MDSETDVPESLASVVEAFSALVVAVELDDVSADFAAEPTAMAEYVRWITKVSSSRYAVKQRMAAT